MAEVLETKNLIPSRPSVVDQQFTRIKPTVVRRTNLVGFTEITTIPYKNIGFKARLIPTPSQNPIQYGVSSTPEVLLEAKHALPTTTMRRDRPA